MNNTILVAVQTEQGSSTQNSLDELKELCTTAGLKTVLMISQNREKPDPNFYLGTGKISELAEQIKALDIQVLVADDELTPKQYKKLEEKLKIKILDRTSVILDIFAKQARTFEAKLQVELAQLEYLLPRLTRMWQHLSRLGGGVGTRGPGEKQIEVDKRQIRNRISIIKEKLTSIKKHRTTQRLKRHNVPLITGVIVGYTNAGKSTLLNTLTNADIYAANKLFATLDPTTKHLVLPNKEEILITDTVGFIRKLPHQLVNSFRSTLEEITEADFLIQVIDISHPQVLATIETTQAILKDLNADHLPILYVFNKIDLLQSQPKSRMLKVLKELKSFVPAVTICATDTLTLAELIKAFEKLVSCYRIKMHFKIPYTKMHYANLLFKYGQVQKQEYKGEFVEIEVIINSIIGNKIMGQMYRE